MTNRVVITKTQVKCRRVLGQLIQKLVTYLLCSFIMEHLRDENLRAKRFYVAYSSLIDYVQKFSTDSNTAKNEMKTTADKS